MFGKLFGRKSADLDELAATYRELKLDGTIAGKIIAHLAKAPDDENPWIGVAIELRQLGYDRCCEATYAAALRRLPNSHRLWGNQAVLFRSQKRFEEAIASLQKALSLKPDYQIALHNVANTYELSGNFTQGLEWYRRAIKVNPKDAPSWNGMANCLAALGDDDAAFDRYRQAMEIDPNYAEPAFNWVLQLVRRGERREAAESLAAYVKRWPDDDQARQLLTKLKDTSQQLPDVHHAYVPEQKQVVVRPVDNTNYENRGAKAGQKTGASPRATIPLSELAKMSPDEAATLGELGAYDKARLWQLVKERVDGTSAPTGTRIFLSYRREESPAYMAWLRKLANALDERGYDVLLDQFVRSLTKSPSVPEMISMMASCTVFSPVLTDRYFDRIDVGDGPVVAHEYLKDGWVFDEYQVAMYLGQMKRLVVTGVWRSGRLRPPFTPDNTIDLRDDRRLETALDRPFPKRKLMVVGMRSADRGRTLGPFRYSEAKTVMEELRVSGEYGQVYIIDALAAEASGVKR